MRAYVAVLILLCPGCSHAQAGAPVRAACGEPPPIPGNNDLYLAYPAPGATGVSDSLGEIVVGGPTFTFFGPTTVTVADGSTIVVAAATPGPEPSPLPSPLATSTAFSGTIPYSAIPLPALSPATTYSVTYTYEDFSETPPSCTTSITTNLGTFVTR